MFKKKLEDKKGITVLSLAMVFLLLVSPVSAHVFIPNEITAQNRILWRVDLFVERILFFIARDKMEFLERQILERGNELLVMGVELNSSSISPIRRGGGYVGMIDDTIDDCDDLIDDGENYLREKGGKAEEVLEDRMVYDIILKAHEKQMEQFTKLIEDSNLPDETKDDIGVLVDDMEESHNVVSDRNDEAVWGAVKELKDSGVSTYEISEIKSNGEEKGGNVVSESGINGG